MHIHTVNEGVCVHAKKTRVGRGTGSGKGKTAGRGSNGQGSRSGSSTSPVFEGGQLPLARRIPKRGFNNKRFAEVVEGVSLKSIVRKFDGSVEIDPALLLEAGLISKSNSVVKLIGDEELTVAYTFKVHRVSKGAKEIVEKAGGRVDILPGKKPVVKNKMKTKAKKAD